MTPSRKKHRAFGAVDWGSDKHSVNVADQAGKVIEDFEIETVGFRLEEVSGKTSTLRLDQIDRLTSWEAESLRCRRTRFPGTNSDHVFLPTTKDEG
jgi:hypothetical protein